MFYKLTQTTGAPLLLALAMFFLVAEPALADEEPLPNYLNQASLGGNAEKRRQVVMDELQKLAGELMRMQKDGHPGEHDHLIQRIRALQEKAGRLEKQHRAWEEYRKSQGLGTDPEKADQATLGPWKESASRTLDKAKLAVLIEEFAVRKAVEAHPMGTPKMGTPDAIKNWAEKRGLDVNKYLTKPTAADYENMAARFEEIVRQVQVGNAADRPFVMYGRLLQAASYLFASRLRLAAKDVQGHEADYLRGIRVADWLVEQDRVGSTSIEAAQSSLTFMPMVAKVDGHVASAAEQARDLLSNYCPWGARTFLMLKQEGLTKDLDWKILRPYGDEKLSVAVVTADRVPAEVAADMEELVRGSLTSGRVPVRLRWKKVPKPTYTIWYVSPKGYDPKNADVIKTVARGVKFCVAGPIALALDEGKGIVVDWASRQIADKGSGIHMAAGHGGNLVDISLVKGFWLAPDAKLGASVGANWWDLTKGGLLDLLSYLEDAESDMLFESLNPKNREINAYFGNPTTYNGDKWPCIMIRADMVAYEEVADYEYMRVWHLNRYYRLDTRAFAGIYGLGDSEEERNRKHAEMNEGTLKVPANAWRRLPEQPRHWGSRVHLADFTPYGHVIRIQFPEKVIKAWRKKIGKNQELLVEIKFPKPLEKISPLPAVVKKYNADFNLGSIGNSLTGKDKEAWEAFRLSARIRGVENKGMEEAFFVLHNKRAHLTLPVHWTAPYAVLLNLKHVSRDFLTKRLTAAKVIPEYFPTLVTGYEARLLSIPKNASGHYMNFEKAKELDRFPVQLLPRPGRGETGERSDVCPGYVMIKQQYKTAPLVKEAEKRKFILFPFQKLGRDGVEDVGTVDAGRQSSLRFIQNMDIGLMYLNMEKVEEKRRQLKEQGDAGHDLPLGEFCEKYRIWKDRYRDDYLLEISVAGQKRYIHRSFDPTAPEGNRAITDLGGYACFQGLSSGQHDVTVKISLLDEAVKPWTVKGKVVITLPEKYDKRQYGGQRAIDGMERVFAEDWPKWSKEEMSESGAYYIRSAIHAITWPTPKGTPPTTRVAAQQQALGRLQEFYSRSGNLEKYADALDDIITDCRNIGTPGAYNVATSAADKLFGVLQGSATPGYLATQHRRLAELAISSSNNVEAARKHLEKWLDCEKRAGEEYNEKAVRNSWPKDWQKERRRRREMEEDDGKK